MSINKFIMIVFALVALLSFNNASYAEKKTDKKAILIASFGTSVPKAKKAIDSLVDSAKKSFPNIEVRLVFTSNIIRRKIAKEQNVHMPTLPEALAKMNDEGYTHVYVMPTHIIPGAEYEDLATVVDAFASIEGKYGFKEIKLGKPYLATIPDCDRMAELLLNRYSEQLADKDSAIVLMGHGTPKHIASALYPQLQLSLDKVAPGRFYMGTVEAAPTIENVIANLKKSKYKNIVISPFLIVAGDHAKNDLVDKNDSQSWYNLLKTAGYKNITPHIVGLGEDAEMQSWFVERIKDMTL